MFVDRKRTFSEVFLKHLTMLVTMYWESSYLNHSDNWEDLSNVQFLQTNKCCIIR